MSALETAAGRRVVVLRSEGSRYELVASSGSAGGELANPLASGETLESMVDAFQQLVPAAANEGRSEIVFAMENALALDQREFLPFVG